MRRSFFLIISIIIAYMCGCNSSDAEPTPIPMSPTQTISPTDEPELTIEPQPTMSEKDIYFMEKEQREEERKALLASPTPGPEPYTLLGTDNEVKVGDVVVFGEYCHHNNIYGVYYDNNPLKWLVLEQREGKILLISLQSVTILSFVSNEEYLEQKDNGFTWENSAIRECLNQYLLYSMFQQDELSCISETVVQTADNPIYGTDGGEDTIDYLFLLSIEEAQKYFSSDSERRTQIVPDVELPQYDLMPYQHYLNTTDYYDWWLRSPGKEPDMAACVGRFGEIMMEGQWVDTEAVSIRPAMWVDLAKVKEAGLEMDVEE
ncbi:MAG: DUF6273 domain-containing protein [Lachnospiraceae bacterium]